MTFILRLLSGHEILKFSFHSFPILATYHSKYLIPFIGFVSLIVLLLELALYILSYFHRSYLVVFLIHEKILSANNKIIIGKKIQSQKLDVHVEVIHTLFSGIK